MQNNKINFGDEKIGIGMIVATLIVILFSVGVFFYQQKTNDINDIQRHGVGLARLLSSMSVEQLTGDGKTPGSLKLLQEGQVNQNFAYASVVSSDGAHSMVDYVTPGVAIPPMISINKPTQWMGDHIHQLPTGETIYEYYAPILEKGNLVAFVRLGYLEPDYSLNASQVRLLAMLAMAIFLLTPVFYFMIKREIRPLTNIGSQLQTLIKKTESGATDLSINSADTKDFMKKFNAVVDAAYDRIDALEEKQTTSVVSSKLLIYQKARLESALNALPCAILVSDESGQVTYASNNIYELLGIKEGEVLGRRITDVSADKELSEYLVICQSSNNIKAHRRHEKEIYLAKTDKRIVVTPYPLYSRKKQDQVLGSVILFRDISNDDLEQKQNGEFVAHVAHELKTPLNILYMYSETLIDNADISREVTIEAANVIHDEIGRISQMIDNLLNLAMIEMGTVSIHRQRVKLAEFLQDIYESTSRNIKDGEIEFNIDLQHGLTTLSLDKDLVRVSINNLISNAIKYTDPGGRVELIAEENDDEVIIRVRDTGIGISERDRHSIFNKFYRSEDEEVRQRTGHGLGLSLVQEAVKLHNGKIELNSTAGKGSEFVMSFAKERNMLKDAV